MVKKNNTNHWSKSRKTTREGGHNFTGRMQNTNNSALHGHQGHASAPTNFQHSKSTDPNGPKKRRFTLGIAGLNSVMSHLKSPTKRLVSTTKKRNRFSTSSTSEDEKKISKNKNATNNYAPPPANAKLCAGRTKAPCRKRRRPGDSPLDNEKTRLCPVQFFKKQNTATTIRNNLNSIQIASNKDQEIQKTSNLRLAASKNHVPPKTKNHQASEESSAKVGKARNDNSSRDETKLFNRGLFFKESVLQFDKTAFQKSAAKPTLDSDPEQTARPYYIADNRVITSSVTPISNKSKESPLRKQKQAKAGSSISPSMAKQKNDDPHFYRKTAATMYPPKLKTSSDAANNSVCATIVDINAFLNGKKAADREVRAVRSVGNRRVSQYKHEKVKTVGRGPGNANAMEKFDLSGHNHKDKGPGKIEIPSTTQCSVTPFLSDGQHSDSRKNHVSPSVKNDDTGPNFGNRAVTQSKPENSDPMHRIESGFHPDNQKVAMQIDSREQPSFITRDSNDKNDNGKAESEPASSDLDAKSSNAEAGNDLSENMPAYPLCTTGDELVITEHDTEDMSIVNDIVKDPFVSSSCFTDEMVTKCSNESSSPRDSSSLHHVKNELFPPKVTPGAGPNAIEVHSEDKVELHMKKEFCHETDLQECSTIFYVKFELPLKDTKDEYMGAHELSSSKMKSDDKVRSLQESDVIPEMKTEQLPKKDTNCANNDTDEMIFKMESCSESALQESTSVLKTEQSSTDTSTHEMKSSDGPVIQNANKDVKNEQLLAPQKESANTMIDAPKLSVTDKVGTKSCHEPALREYNSFPCIKTEKFFHDNSSGESTEIIDSDKRACIKESGARECRISLIKSEDFKIPSAGATSIAHNQAENQIVDDQDVIEIFSDSDNDRSLHSSSSSLELLETEGKSLNNQRLNQVQSDGRTSKKRTRQDSDCLDGAFPQSEAKKSKSREKLAPNDIKNRSSSINIYVSGRKSKKHKSRRRKDLFHSVNDDRTSKSEVKRLKSRRDNLATPAKTAAYNEYLEMIFLPCEKKSPELLKSEAYIYYYMSNLLPPGKAKEFENLSLFLKVDFRRAGANYDESFSLVRQITGVLLAAMGFDHNRGATVGGFVTPIKPLSKPPTERASSVSKIVCMQIGVLKATQGEAACHLMERVALSFRLAAHFTLVTCEALLKHYKTDPAKRKRTRKLQMQAILTLVVSMRDLFFKVIGEVTEHSEREKTTSCPVTGNVRDFFMADSNDCLSQAEVLVFDCISTLIELHGESRMNDAKKNKQLAEYMLKLDKDGKRQEVMRAKFRISGDVMELLFRQLLFYEEVHGISEDHPIKRHLRSTQRRLSETSGALASILDEVTPGCKEVIRKVANLRQYHLKALLDFNKKSALTSSQVLSSSIHKVSQSLHAEKDITSNIDTLRLDGCMYLSKVIDVYKSTTKFCASKDVAGMAFYLFHTLMEFGPQHGQNLAMSTRNRVNLESAVLASMYCATKCLDCIVHLKQIISYGTIVSRDQASFRSKGRGYRPTRPHKNLIRKYEQVLLIQHGYTAPDSTMLPTINISTVLEHLELPLETKLMNKFRSLFDSVGYKYSPVCLLDNPLLVAFAVYHFGCRHLQILERPAIWDEVLDDYSRRSVEIMSSYMNEMEKSQDYSEPSSSTPELGEDYLLTSLSVMVQDMNPVHGSEEIVSISV